MPTIAQVSHAIPLPEGVSASLEGNNVTLSKDGESLTREFNHNRVSVRRDDGDLRVFCELPRRSEKAIAGTWAAHLRNMAKGLDEGFEYRLKAVFSHFPMTQGSGQPVHHHEYAGREGTEGSKPTVDACGRRGQDREQVRRRRHRR